jgi:hypothetical protein
MLYAYFEHKGLLCKQMLIQQPHISFIACNIQPVSKQVKSGFADLYINKWTENLSINYWFTYTIRQLPQLLELG